MGATSGDTGRCNAIAASPVPVDIKPAWRPPPIPSRPDSLSFSQSKPKERRNTKNLGLRLGADAASAVVAGALVAPIITIIDRYVEPLT